MPEQKTQQDRIEELEKEVAQLKRKPRRPPVRKRSRQKILGMPLYDVAIGPDPQKGQPRGIARGFFAVGDVAVGVFALGGAAAGVFAVGGLSFGVLLAIGGVGVGGVAVGGAAVGVLAIGGAAVGAWALGGATLNYFDWANGQQGELARGAIKQAACMLRLVGQSLFGADQLS